MILKNFVTYLNSIAADIWIIWRYNWNWWKVAYICSFIYKDLVSKYVWNSTNFIESNATFSIYKQGRKALQLRQQAGDARKYFTGITNNKNHNAELKSTVN